MDAVLNSRLFRNQLPARRGSKLNLCRGWALEVVREEGMCLWLRAQERIFTWGDPLPIPLPFKVGRMLLDGYFILIKAWRADLVVIKPLAPTKRKAGVFLNFRLFIRFKDEGSETTKDLSSPNLAGSLTSGQLTLDSRSRQRLERALTAAGIDYRPHLVPNSHIYSRLNQFFAPEARTS